MKQKIFILGASGNVGRELITQIIEKDIGDKHVNPSEIVGIANSSTYIFDARGIDIQILQKVSSSREKAVSSFMNIGKTFKKLDELLGIIKADGLDGEIIFADVTAGKEELLYFHKKILLESQNFLVTANKNPISLFSQRDFQDLTIYARRYDTNTTVMGGAGILNFVHERTNGIADNISHIQGVFSGTLGYILSELEKQEKPFSEIVINAKQLGYTEPNPWDDLNGLDVARKLVILARYAGHKVDISDVEIQPLIDKKYASYIGEDFFKNLENEDERFSYEVDEASKRGNVLRYIAEMKYEFGKLTLKVGIKEVEKNSDLGALGGTLNLALITTDILSYPLPHVIKSRGAGLGVTAGAVRVGISKMLPSYIESS